MGLRMSPARRIAFWLPVIALGFLTVSPPRACPQSGLGTLSGKITTISGSPISKSKLSIRNTATGEAVSVDAREDGTYTVRNLRPGDYELVASALGFIPKQISIKIHPGINQAPNLVLEAAGSGQPTASPTVSGVVSSKSVRELPLNGRSASDLATLEAGVTSARTQATGRGQYGFGTQMTISGGRPRQNDSRLDGISVNDYANGPPGSALGVSLGVDAVEQFKVLTSSYPAQVGRSSGGVIAASTRSGTNDFHGDVFEFLRNSAFDARNFFDAAKPPFRRNQFGASAGGPLRKNHTFIFGDYEGLRQSQGVTQVDTVPSPAARTGQLCAPPDCSTTTAVAIDSQVSRFLQAFYPAPNGALLCPFTSCAPGTGDTGRFSFSGQQVTPENYFTTKLDHKISASDTLSGTYMFDSGTVRQPDEFNNKITGYDSRRQFFTFSESHTFRVNLLNSFRFGINRVVTSTGETFPGANPLTSDTSFATVPGLDAASIIVPGLTLFSGGLGAASHFNFHWTTIQAYDDFSWTKANHSLKFGFALERIRDNMFGVSDPNGQFRFNSLSDFLTNAPFSLAVSLPGARSGRGIRQTVFGTYIQDDWRWRSNLTISLGLRYEMATVPTEVSGKLTVLRNLTDALPHLGDPLFSNPTLRNFEPRLGLSWDPLGSAKTTVSAGFGIFDVLPLPYLIQFNELFSSPFYESGNVTNLPAASFPTTAFTIVSSSSSTFRQGYFDPHPKRSYVMQWNLTLQRQLATDFSLRAGYVGSRAIHQPFRVEDADIVPPVLTPEGYLWPSPVGSGTRLNLNTGRLTAAFWEGEAYYDALQVQVKEKIGASSQLGASYTWGKTIDTSSGSLVGDEYANSISSPLWFDTRLNRGLADFNVAQNLEVNYTWDLGAPKWNSRVGKWTLGGWQLGGIFEASTGVPFTPGFAGDALGVGSTDPNIDVPNLVGGPGCGSLVNPGNPVHYIKTQCFSVPVAPTQSFYTANCDPKFAFPLCLNLRGNLGRNTLIGPGLINFDFSLFKNNYVKRISDAFNIQFRAELFNVLNRANFAPPLDNKNIFDANGSPVGSAGLITSTQTPSRQIQFALKLIW